MVVIASAGLLLLVLLLTELGALWDIGPLAPLLFRPTALVTIVPTRLDSQATLLITAVTGTPATTQHEIAARFVSVTSPVLVAMRQSTGAAPAPGETAHGTLTYYQAATYTPTT